MPLYPELNCRPGAGERGGVQGARGVPLGGSAEGGAGQAWRKVMPCRRHLAPHSWLGGDMSKGRGRMRSEDQGRRVCCFLLPCLTVRKLSVLRALVSLVWDDHTHPHCLQAFLKSNEGCKLYCKLLGRLSSVWGLITVALLYYCTSYLLPRFTVAI